MKMPFISGLSLLKQGYEIAASSGRDWHRLYPGEEIAYTYILVSQDETEEDILTLLNWEERIFQFVHKSISKSMRFIF